MRFEKRRKKTKILEGDLTPMIDMAFQLIAFFMLLINFSEVEKTEEINLPDSVIAKPPEEVPEYTIMLNLDDDGTVSLGPKNVGEVEGLRPILTHEIGMAARERVAKENINVIIRADRNVRTGLVRDLMRKCGEVELVDFALRVKSQVR